MESIGSGARQRWRWVLWAFVAAYVPVISLLGSWHGLVVGPLSVGPALLAAWWLGARGGALMALALAPFHVALTLLLREQPLWVALLVNTLNVCAGCVVGVLFERLRRATNYQLECEQRYERAARAASDGLFEWQLDSGDMYMSERFAELIGMERTKLKHQAEEWFARVHPDDEPELRRAILAHRAGLTASVDHDYRLRCQDHGYLWVHVHGQISRSGGSELLTAWTCDVSARKQAEQELRFHAFRDPLTGLANRSLFMDRLAQALTRRREGQSAGAALLLIDLDRFKRINDSLGHAAANGLLLEVAERLRNTLGPGDTLARLGGDEFAMLLEDRAQPDQIVDVARKVRTVLLEPLSAKGRAVTSGCSIGIALAEPDCDSPADLMRDADTALYRAKALGRGRWAMFDRSMRERAVERLTLENELRVGMLRGEIELFYQPIVDMSSGFRGFEALPRWRNPRLGLLLPGEFIGLAEETGLIMELGELVLRQACAMGQRVIDAIGDQEFTVHINMSPKQFRRADVVQRMEALLAEARFDPSRLCVEVTEDLVLEELPTGGALFERLRQRGVKLCMDDFGTGYSSLSYLHRFRMDYLKIETAFVHGAESRDGGVQIVRSLINLAKNLGIVAVAEGVETQRQWELLRSLGCPRAQGYFIARPLSAQDLLAWVQQRYAACA